MVQGLDPRSVRATAREGALQLGVIVAGGLALAWPALYNGYPLVFQDSGWYLARLYPAPLHPGRGIGYPIFVGGVSLGQTLWPIVAAQSLIMSALVVRSADLAIGFREPRRVRAGLCVGAVSLAVLALLSGLPKYASWITADITTSWIFLAGMLWLLGRGVLDRVAASAVTAFVVLTHNSHLPLVLGMIAVVVVASVAMSASWRQGLVAVRGLLALGVACLVWVPLAALAVGGDPSWFRGGSSLVLYRLIDSGVAVETLDTYCHERSWVACRYRDEIAKHVGEADGWFLFRRDSPFEAMRGWKGEEQGEIVSHALRCCWPTIGKKTLEGAWQQLFRIDSRDGLRPEDVAPVEFFLDHKAWKEHERLVGSRQARDELDRIVLHPFPETPLHVGFWVAAAGVAFVGARRGRWEGAALVGAVLVFLVGNALVCSFGSSIHDRYQGRVAPLLPFALVIATGWLLRGRKRPPTSARRPG